MLVLRGDDHCADDGLGCDFMIDFCLAAEPPYVLSVFQLPHMIFNNISGNDGLAEFRFVDRHEINELRPTQGRPARNAQSAGGLRHSFNQQHAGENRLCREVSGELRLVIRDILDADAGFVAALFAYPAAA